MRTRRKRPTPLDRVMEVFQSRGFKRLQGDCVPGIGAVGDRQVYTRLVAPDTAQRVVCPLDGTGRWLPDKKNPDPFVVSFAVRDSDGVIRKVGSERRVWWDAKLMARKLATAILDWENQLAEVDTPCNKCQDGIYRFERDGETVEVPCNRCGGKGYQDYNDRRRNENYDRRASQEHVDRPHWHPYN